MDSKKVGAGMIGNALRNTTSRGDRVHIDISIVFTCECDRGPVGREHRIVGVPVALSDALDAGAIEVADVDLTRSTTAAVAVRADPGQFGTVG